MRRFLVKKTGDCGSPPTTKKPKADLERLAAAREYEDRRRRGFKAAWRDEFAWLTYEPAPADSDSNGAQVGAPAATGSASSDDTTTAQPLSQYKMFCTPCRASYGVSASTNKRRLYLIHCIKSQNCVMSIKLLIFCY